MEGCDVRGVVVAAIVVVSKKNSMNAFKAVPLRKKTIVKAK
jgi:hypothetical protein